MRSGILGTHEIQRYKKKSKMIATETTEDTEGKYSVLSVYSVAETIRYIQLKKKYNL
jgi:hypothetical protein